MTIGRVNDDLEAVVRLRLTDHQGQVLVLDAVIDTGFDGYLTLPRASIHHLGLERIGNGETLLGDGSVIRFDVFAGLLDWNGAIIEIEIDGAGTDPCWAQRCSATTPSRWKYGRVGL